MNKRKQILSRTLLILSLAFLFMSCNKGKTFTQLQIEEEVVIKNFIKDFNYKVVSEKPDVDNWPHNTFYKTSSGLHIYIINKGDETDTIRTNLTVGYRFKEHELDKDTTLRLKNWEPRDFNNPSKMIYGTNDAISNYGAGLHEALGIMKNYGSEAYAIVPSNLNLTSYSMGRDRLIPVMYHLKITLIK